MKTWRYFVIVWPILLLAGWLIAEDFRARQGELVEIAIAGYDPRDLLAGHYVTYRLDLGEAGSCSAADVIHGAYCFCLKVADDRLAKADFGAPCREERTKSCQLKIKGRCPPYVGVFESGIERYYIPEEYAPFLQTIPAESRIVARIDGNGRASLQGFKVGGKDLGEYVAEQRAAASR